MINVLLVAGARPNFMKVAPLMKELRERPGQFSAKLLHTGQHYDFDMSDVFLEELGLGAPDLFLGIGSGTHAEQTGKIMMAFEQVCVQDRPDVVVVVGDVNSTMACAITAKKLCLPVAHVEAGLRSRDWMMPEEINRLVTDSVSDLLFTPSRDADRNLLGEGVAPERIHFVGNVMIDSLLALLARTQDRDTLRRFGVEEGRYATLTLHRPSNVDDPATLGGIIDALSEIGCELPILWPLHPRSRKNLEQWGILQRLDKVSGIIVSPPLGYLDMLALNRKARIILTDSGRSARGSDRVAGAMRHSARQHRASGHHRIRLQSTGGQRSGENSLHDLVGAEPQRPRHPNSRIVGRPRGGKNRRSAGAARFIVDGGWFRFIMSRYRRRAMAGLSLCRWCKLKRSR